MARSLFLVFLVLASCAQVGSITGGEKDTNPPRVKKSTVVNGQTLFNGQSISIVFDEYVQLNKPQENLILVPADVTPEASLNKKTLTITWKESLQPNTTYTLYLNGIVKDVTEGNDSLIQLTFSTGKTLDSLQFNARVIDAQNGELRNGILVGLYDSLNAEKPRYFAKSNADGLASLKYIKQGTYFSKAVEDKNSDLITQLDEFQDAKYTSFTVDTAFRDTIKFYLSKPEGVTKLGNSKIIAPGILAFHLPQDLKPTNLFLNGKQLVDEQINLIGKDSAHVLISELTNKDIELIGGEDTLRIINTDKNRQAPLKLTFLDDRNSPGKLVFELNDWIKTADTSLISVRNAVDSSRIAFGYSVKQNKLILLPNAPKVKDLLVEIKPKAIVGFSLNQNLALKQTIPLKTVKDYGVLMVNLDSTLAGCIVQLIQKEKIVDERMLEKGKKMVRFENLQPGEYTFRIIVDANKNGKWDPIQPKVQSPAEKILFFNKPVKVRANWDTETQLILD